MWRVRFVTLLALLTCGCSRPELIYINESTDHRHDLALQQSLAIATDKSQAEFALMRLHALPKDTTAKQYAVSLIEKNRIGDSRSGRGVLILEIENPHQIKIEVTYSLEGVLPDITTDRLEHAAETYFQSDIAQDFYSELLITLSNSVKEMKTPEENFELGETWRSRFLSGGAGSFAEFSPEDVLQKIDELPKEKLTQFQPGKSVSETLERYLKSLAQGAGDPNLPLLTKGSQIFRIWVPRTRAQLRRIYQDYERARKMPEISKETEALILFEPSSSTLPIYLRRNDKGVWLVDEVKSWTYFHRFENSPMFYILTDDTPFRDELVKRNWPTALCTIYKKRFSAPVTDLGKRDLPTRADWILFETGHWRMAKELLQQQLATAPEDLATRWKLFHVLMNLSEMDLALEQLSQLYAKTTWDDREAFEWWYQYRNEYRRAELRFTNSPLTIAKLKAIGFWDWLRWKVLSLTHYDQIHDPCLAR